MITFDFLFTSHSPEHIHGQCRQFVLTWIDKYGSQIAQSAPQSLGDVLAVGNGTCKDDGIHMSVGRWCQRSHPARRAVDHGVEHQPGLLVTLSDAPLHLPHVVGAQMSRQSASVRCVR